MAFPPPLLGGIGLALSAYSLLALNGRVFGISGFLHRGVKGAEDGAIAIAGLILGGFIAGQIEGIPPPATSHDLDRIVVSGLLVGLGTKLANGCTSGHMLCGLARRNLRSLIATVTFCATGAATARILHGSQASTSATVAQTNLGPINIILLGGSALLLVSAWLVSPTGPSEPPEKRRRNIVQLLVAMSFALSLRTSKLVDPHRVLGFLLLPWHPAFDSTLLYLAAGALPLLAVLYQLNPVKISKSGVVDRKLIVGSALFGVGWGIEGICPGPGLVNLGQALATKNSVGMLAAWLIATVAGGLAV